MTVPDSGSATAVVMPDARSWTCSAPPLTYATRRAGGVGAGIDDGTGGVERPRGRAAGRRSTTCGRPDEGERGEARRPVRGVGDDAARLLPRPLAAGPLLGRQVLVAAGLERARVGHDAFLARRHVERPEAGDGVGAAAAAQERHARAVGREADAAGRAEREAAGPGLAAGEGVRHGRQSARRRTVEIAAVYPGGGRFVPPREGVSDDDHHVPVAAVAGGGPRRRSVRLAGRGARRRGDRGRRAVAGGRGPGPGRDPRLGRGDRARADDRG